MEELIECILEVEMKTVLVTGGFDPLHSGHIEYFKEAKKLGDRLVVGVNSDEWLTRKKGRPFMPFEERAKIIQELKVVDDVIGFNDSDGTANAAIFHILSTTSGDVIFANGGDRTAKNIPEMNMFGNRNDVKFHFGVGGENKLNSSSWILDEWKTQKTVRTWGYWRVLDNKPETGVKVKELVVYPNCGLSDQKHYHRNEHWYILSGRLTMHTEYNKINKKIVLNPHDKYEVGKGVWHKASNDGTEPCHIIEIQYGEKCEETDIERRFENKII